METADTGEAVAEYFCSQSQTRRRTLKIKYLKSAEQEDVKPFREIIEIFDGFSRGV
jgi:hypothetical protein